MSSFGRERGRPDRRRLRHVPCKDRYLARVATEPLVLVGQPRCHFRELLDRAPLTRSRTLAEVLWVKKARMIELALRRSRLCNLVRAELAHRNHISSNLSPAPQKTKPLFQRRFYVCTCIPALEFFCAWVVDSTDIFAANPISISNVFAMPCSCAGFVEMIFATSCVDAGHRQPSVDAD